MKTVVLAAAVLAAAVFGSSPSRADVIEDPLHGFCTGCVHTNVGGNDVTVLGPDGVTNFGFNASPANSGILQLKFLVPNSVELSAVQAFALATSVTGTSSSSLSLFSTTAWTSGFLETDYLGNTLASGAPKNPLDAWLGATQTLAPTASGYFLLTANMGQYSLGTPGQGSDNLFSLAPAEFFAGGLIVGNLFTPDGVVSTAQSSALFNPVPGPIVGAGLPGLIAAAFGLLALARRRKAARTA